MTDDGLMSRVASAYRRAADAPGTTKAERDRWLAIATGIDGTNPSLENPDAHDPRLW